MAIQGSTPTPTQAELNTCQAAVFNWGVTRPVFANDNSGPYVATPAWPHPNAYPQGTIYR